MLRDYDEYKKQSWELSAANKKLEAQVLELRSTQETKDYVQTMAFKQ